MKFKGLKKVVLSFVALLSVGTVGTTVVQAETVHYKGYNVSWEHGRTWGVNSYSRVMTSKFRHSATANTTFSGIKAPGVVAYAQQNVGTGTATAYWRCY
ncbi:hypothetical protein [Companilactobacillus metriopterae]|uniref:hypothetical protein n=1 Tax=Companilactobacillus metriopterae TaxID=1909267 RepID=UPI00100BA021|nr:hypothetical protein [Companilactobacillus metriopterae]